MFFIIIFYQNAVRFNLIPETQDGGQSGTTAFLTSVVNLCTRSRNDWYRVYLIRKICSRLGVEFVLKLLKMDEMRWLFPEEVLQKVQLYIFSKYQMTVWLFSKCNGSNNM